MKKSFFFFLVCSFSSFVGAVIEVVTETSLYNKLEGEMSNKDLELIECISETFIPPDDSLENFFLDIRWFIVVRKVLIDSDLQQGITSQWLQVETFEDVQKLSRLIFPPWYFLEVYRGVKSVRLREESIPF